MTTHLFTYDGDASQLRCWLVPVEGPVHPCAYCPDGIGIAYEDGIGCTCVPVYRPYDPGDVCEFGPKCRYCSERPAVWLADLDVPVCDVGDGERFGWTPLEPTRRTISNVRADQLAKVYLVGSAKSREIGFYPPENVTANWVWVLELEEQPE